MIALYIVSCITLLIIALFIFNLANDDYQIEENKNECKMIDYDMANALEHTVTK